MQQFGLITKVVLDTLGESIVYVGQVYSLGDSL